MVKRGFSFEMSEVLLRQIILDAMGLDTSTAEINWITMNERGNVDIYITGTDERFPLANEKGEILHKTPIVRKRTPIEFLGFSEDEVKE